MESTKNTIGAVVDMVREKITDRPIEIAYMEFCEENMNTESKSWPIRELRRSKWYRISSLKEFTFRRIFLKK